MSKVFIGLWLLLLIAIATWTDVRGVSDYHYSEDESLHVGIAQASSLQDVIRYSLYETHPPLGHILRFYWMKISDAEWFVRSLSLLFGIALIPLYYIIGKMLNGAFTGMCSAALIAFSHGCIIQAYTARNYSIFLFFISLSFYFYLLWRDKGKKSALFYYTLFAVAACLTHFSAIFVTLTLVLYEATTRYLNKEPLHLQMTWLLANIFVASVAIAAYYLWATRGTVIGGFSMGSTMTNGLMAALLAIYPINSVLYLLPSLGIIPFIVFSLILPAVREDKNLWRFCGLTGIAFIIGMILLATQHYYPSGTRHGIWTLPFIIPAVGWIIAGSVKELNTFIAQKLSIPSEPVVAILILLTGWMLYSSEDRFAVNSEYQMKEKDWQAMSQYLATLDKRSVIIAARDDAILLQSTYPYLAGAPFSGKIMAIAIPHDTTHIITNPVARRFSNKDILIETLNDANQRHILDNADTLVFMKTIWETPQDSQSPLPYLATCEAINKKIASFPEFSFPDLPLGKNITDEEMKIAPVAFISISKKEFFEHVITENSKAHNCLVRNND